VNLDRAFNVAAAIVGLAIIATLVASRNTATIVKSVGDSFSGSIRAAKGTR